MKLIMFLIIVLMIIMWHCKPMLMRDISAKMMSMLKRVTGIGIIQKCIAKVKNGIGFLKGLISKK